MVDVTIVFMGFINLWEYFGIEDIIEKSHLDPKKNLPLNMNNGVYQTVNQ